MIADHHDTIEDAARCPVCGWIIDLEIAEVCAKAFGKISEALKRRDRK